MPKSPSAVVRAASAAVLVDNDPDAVARFFAAEYVAHAGGRARRGHRAVRQSRKILHQAFPRLRVDVDILAEDGRRVAWMRTLRGVQAGAYGGFPASGRRLTWREQVVSDVRDGVIAEEWLVGDLAEQLLRARKR